MSTTRTIEIYADTRGFARCRGCGAAIEWAEIVATGKKMCFDTAIVALATRHSPQTNRLIEVVDLETNHWASCPDAAKFKRR